ncbi:hypothetical protein SS50377_22842 [Spironucleus salmonicida]|uniref:Trichohyalin-plectin-homology domain-containing protein n=1 Tax=Spironucleus salmonicida TaxID=348837 RepID=V6LTC8_9EUKA|nr:hypothetical protein SS50377_22842 [Spironucleus salmonicida]|eukprot:EST47902.1 Hypothetical protein SS50377_12005 [Spironucleus salmonicida]
MPYTDSVFYKANNHAPPQNNPLPNIISTSHLDQMRFRAHPTNSKTTENDLQNTQNEQIDVKEANIAVTRASKWSNTDFSNEDIRIQKILAHKKNIQNEMYKNAETYENRLKARRQEEVEIAKAKISDNSEYSRYLKVARNAADCARFEKEWKVENRKKCESEAQNDANYRAFLEGAAAKEKTFKSVILQRARENCKKCSDFNEKIFRDQVFDKTFGTFETEKELAEAKIMHQRYVEDCENERISEIEKKQKTAEMYEFFLQKEQEKRDAFQKERKMLYQEEIRTDSAKDSLQDYTKAKQSAFQQKIRDANAVKQKNAEHVIQEAEEKKQAVIDSMMHAKVDGQRKKEQQKQWYGHWKSVNQDVYETQQIQEAERHAISVTAKMEDMAYGRRMIELVEDERQAEGVVRQRLLEEKRQRGIAQRQEVDIVVARKKRDIALEKEADKKEIVKKMKEFRAEQQIPIIAAREEKNEEYKKSYNQVVRFMDRQETGVSWINDVK